MTDNNAGSLERERCKRAVTSNIHVREISDSGKRKNMSRNEKINEEKSN